MIQYTPPPVRRDFPIAGNLVAVYPLLAFALVCSWSTVIGPEVPVWLARDGLKFQWAMLAGLLPGLTCGVAGLLTIATAVRHRSTSLALKGIWALVAAPILCFYLMVLTF